MLASRPAHPARRPGVVLAALTAAAGLALAGCAADEVPDAPAPAPAPAPKISPGLDQPDQPVDAATIAWTGTVCSAIAPAVETLRTPPPIDFTNPAATRDAYLNYIDATLQESRQAVQQIQDAGAPPVEGGDELAGEVRSQVEDLTQDLTEARAQLERTDPNDVNAMGQAVATVGNLIGSVGNSAQAIGEVRVDPRLDPAFEQAPQCQQLTATGNGS